MAVDLNDKMTVCLTEATAMVAWCSYLVMQCAAGHRCEQWSFHLPVSMTSSVSKSNLVALLPSSETMHLVLGLFKVYLHSYQWSSDAEFVKMDGIKVAPADLPCEGLHEAVTLFSLNL